MIDSRIAYVTVEHSYFGCETGCCGWIAYAYDSDKNILHQSKFEFMHSYADTVEEAAEFAQEHFPGAKFNAEESDWKCTN